MASSFKDQYGPWAVIAGASDGTGRAFARKVAARGISCILVANSGPLEEAAAEIRAESGVDAIPASIDLGQETAFDQILAAAGDREIGLYIGNAGSDPNTSHYLDIGITPWLQLANINIITTMKACHHFGRGMRERHRGGILLVNSGACYGGGAVLTMYTACKGFQLNFAEGLWAELKPAGVDVLTIVLGQTDTPSYHRIQQKLGMPPGPNLAAPEDVAETGLARLPHGPVHNFGLSDEDAGGFLASARQRRERVNALTAATEVVFGKYRG